MLHTAMPVFHAASILLLATALVRGAPSPDAHAAGTAAAAGDAGAGVRPCPVPVCKYQGTAWAEDRIGDELVDRGEAAVVWTFSHMDGREAVYVAAGDVSAAWRTDRCAIALAPAAYEFTPASPGGAHRRLKVDFTTRPIRYSGIGSSEWAGTQTWSCANSTPFTEEGIATKWFAAEEVTSSEPGLLQGTFESETVRSGWEFRVAP